MAEPHLEEVFKLSGIPTYTFVEPMEYEKLVVALRTPGRGVVIEGPSGIGKTTAVTRALEQLELKDAAMTLSARKGDDREVIAELPHMKDIGTVLVDDFHRLDDAVKREVADYLKTLADEEAEGSKLVVIGINRAGDSLVRFASDLVNRIDTIRFEVDPAERVQRLVEQGEEALNIDISIKDEIVANANGSFYLAQMLSQEVCLGHGVKERQEVGIRLDMSYEVVLGRVMDRLSAAFLQIATSFAAGTKLRREGRAPYLHILRWLAEANEWSIDLEREAARHPTLKGSVKQVVDKGHLATVLENDPEIGKVLHFDAETSVLGAEDPQFVFFIRNLAWRKFAERVGYLNIDFEAKYDFALSFAGTDRELAEGLFEALSARELAVFYDKNEQARILAENVEDYLGPIYRSEATYVVPLLGSEFPKRIWTKFESDQFRARFGENSVIPIWFSDVEPGAFDEDRKVGGTTFRVDADFDSEIDRIADLLAEKMRERSLRTPTGNGAAEPESLFEDAAQHAQKPERVT